ncbi:MULTISPECIES: NAD(P)/FAD-dependent oxidoreductase [unclassified Thalassospira]|uniref:NAD(P)/FAD-dependent oxidoreductase n=1 Tax=unclassified Thalassospira TaxID=2648997 RepID=UPI000EEF9984|nr:MULTISPECIES: FAD-binding oxidoreductase [unclassified Thalassospira]HAI29791.1 amino acid dehydrogenase [Thalassospira sp.]|tara:strand:- start:5222 stop:6460 length:1239 start_codon:yes stop_codon:yes gene_type:complete
MQKVIVIGGGVVGISCALKLQDEGYEVTVLDPGEPGEGASWASCGSIAVSEVVPLSKPGTMRRAPGWMLDPTGPLTLRAGSALRVLPWFLRFAGNARASQIDKISREISVLTRTALADTQAFLGALGLSDLLRHQPVIELYDSAQDLDHERVFHDARRALGFDLEEISGAQAAELEPSIASDFAYAVVLKDWRSVVDAKRFVMDLHKVFVERGGKTKRVGAKGFVREDHKVTAVHDDKGDAHVADQFVIAAGAYSRRLAAELDCPIQMEGVIGYQTSFIDPGVTVEHGLIYAKGGFGITPYESGLAIAGSIEFAHLDAQPNWKRADILVQKAKRVVPDLETRNGERRFGRRPLTPDTKPIIGKVPGMHNVMLATGHGQLGVTLAATTGRLVSEMMTGRQTEIDMSAYKADRF